MAGGDCSRGSFDRPGSIGEDAVELAARGDVEFGEDFAEVVLDGAGSDESGRDLRIRQAVTRHARHLALLRRQSRSLSPTVRCGQFRRWPAVRAWPVRRTPPCPSTPACRGRCGVLPWHRRVVAPVAAIRRTAGGHAPGRPARGCDREARSIHGRDSPRRHLRSVVPASAPRYRAPRRCGLRWSSRPADRGHRRRCRCFHCVRTLRSARLIPLVSPMKSLG